MYKICYSEAFTWYKLRKIVYEYFAKEARKGMRVLEVGCNVGANIQMFNDLFPDARDMEFYGVDISEKAIQIAKEKVKNRSFAVGDAENLGYKDNCFDIIVCTEVLEHLPTPYKALKEIHRVLNWNGIIIITTPNKENILKKMAGKKIKERVEADCQTVPPHQKREGSFGHISVLSSRELIQTLKKVGFKVERIRKGSLVYGLPFFDRHQIFFGFLLILDTILDHIPFTYNFSWNCCVKARKVRE